MTTYIQGTDDFPEEFPEIDDSETPQAADFNPAYEALANRTRYLRTRLLPIPALDWYGQVPTNFNQTRGVYSKVEQTWYIVGDDPGTDQFERLQSLEDITGFEDLSAALGGGALTVYDIACRQSTGDLIIPAKGSRDVYSGVLAGYGSLDNSSNWTKKANALAAVPSALACDWDDVNDRFIVVYRVGSSGMHFEFWDGVSPAFTPATTIPATWTGYTGSNNPEIACSRGNPSGTMLACFFDAAAVSHRLRVARSTNGGVLFTDLALTSTIGDYVKVSKPAFNPKTKRWYLAGSSSAPRTEIWESSDDGITFGPVAVVSGFECNGIAAVDDLLVLLGRDQRIAYSIDRAVTWKFAGRRLPSTATDMHLLSGGGGLLFTNNVTKKSWRSMRIGNEGQVIS